MALRGVRRVLLSGRVNFNPTTLFASNTGGWWDPSDLSTLFQDSAGTTPVTAAGQAVGLMKDKSGNANHLAQATAGSRPILRNSGSLWWLEFDGVSGFMIKVFTLSQPISRVSAVQQVSWKQSGCFWDGGVTNGALLFQNGTTPEIDMYAGNTGPNSTSMPLGANHVVSELFNGAGTTLGIDNLTPATGSVAVQSAGGFTLATDGDLSTGLCANILFYGSICIGRVLTASETSSCKTFFGAKAGLTL